MHRSRVAALVGVVSAVAVGACLLSSVPAAAATVNCASPPGTNQTIIDQRTACGTESDGTSNSVAYGDDGVGYARAGNGGMTLGAGVGGGVGAGETSGGILTAIAVGPNAVALGSVDRGTLSFVLAGPGSQAFVGNPGERIICIGSAALAMSFASGTGCVSSGGMMFVLP